VGIMAAIPAEVVRALRQNSHYVAAAFRPAGLGSIRWFGRREKIQGLNPDGPFRWIRPKYALKEKKKKTTQMF